MGKKKKPMKLVGVHRVKEKNSNGTKEAPRTRRLERGGVVKITNLTKKWWGKKNHPPGKRGKPGFLGKRSSRRIKETKRVGPQPIKPWRAEGRPSTNGERKGAPKWVTHMGGYLRRRGWG